MTDGIYRVATYNVHGGIGTDGHYDPARTADVIAETGADVIALQEVEANGGRDLFTTLSDRFGGHAAEGPAVIDGPRRYGNLVLSRWPIAEVEIVDLAYRRREPRNAIFAVIHGPNGPFRIVATHFGLARRERWAQAELIGALIRQHDEGPLVIAGDFNDWPPLSRAGRLIRRSLGLGLRGARRRRTFPSRFPILALDRILVRPGACLVASRAHRSPASRVASDHLPVIADIRAETGC